MSFVQIIEFRTTDIDALVEVGERWWTATEGKRTVRRAIIGRDCNDSGRYVELVFFDSYESAMLNSNLPETQAASADEAALTESGFTFRDLDVVFDRS